MVGLRKARETIDSAASKVTASAELTARAIGAIAGIALVALLVGLAALMVGMRARRMAHA